MEFRLPNINLTESVCLRFRLVGNDPFNSVTSKLWIEIIHDRNEYNSIYDDILFIDGCKRGTITSEELKVYATIPRRLSCYSDRYYILNCCMLNFDHEIDNGYVSNLNGYFQSIYIKKPTSDKINVVEVKYTEKIIDKIVIQEKVVEKEKLVAPDTIEKCPICADKIATINLSCCSINYCGQCAFKINTCSQCRKPVNKERVKCII
jgi:hypothetical protein